MNSGGQKRKYAVNDAIWIAAALLAYKNYITLPDACHDDMYFKQTDIVYKAQEIAEKTVRKVRLYQYVNAENEKATQNYLRADLKGDSSALRLAKMDEFDEKTYPSNLDMTDVLAIDDKEITLGDLFDFVRTVYPVILENDRYEWKSGDERKENPGSDMINRKAIEQIRKFRVGQNKVKYDKNMILYGPPGTGKTYHTAIYAVAVCDEKSLTEVEAMPYENVLERYRELKDNEKRIAFTTFHQSYGYEEFIEGIKPKMDSGSKDIEYTIKDGVFKAFCDRAGQKKAETAGVKVRDGARVWNVILGGSARPDLKQICFDEGTIRIGWDKWPEIITEETENLNDKERRILLNFQDEMEIGDIVVARSTASAVDGIGIVCGEAEIDDSVEGYTRKRKVEWIHKGKDIEIIDLNDGTRLDRKSVYELGRVNASDLLSRIPANADVEVEDETRPYVFIIDEINRGNISKIFGELITLIEPAKRKGASEAMEVTLPYSNKSFGVPDNVYIIGTMNTADRSIALMDTALRRRFQFIEKMPDVNILRKIGADKIYEGDAELDVAYMLERINERIEHLFDREHTIGHAFFMGLKDEPTVAKLADIFKKSVVPLLQEYFYEDYSKIMLVLGDNGKEHDEQKFVLATEIKANTIFRGDTSDIDISDYSYQIQESAFEDIKSYIEITG